LASTQKVHQKLVAVQLISDFSAAAANSAITNWTESGNQPSSKKLHQ